MILGCLGDLHKQHGYRNRSIFGRGLGNEMMVPSGGHKTAYEYSRLANETAKTYRKFDEDLELITVVVPKQDDDLS